MKAIVVAGGQATRLRPLSLLLPKPLVPVLNRPVLSHVLRRLAAHGITEVGISIGPHGHPLKDYYTDGADWGVSLTWLEEPSPLGTGGCLHAHLDFFEGAPAPGPPTSMTSVLSTGCETATSKPSAGGSKSTSQGTWSQTASTASQDARSPPARTWRARWRSAATSASNPARRSAGRRSSATRPPSARTPSLSNRSCYLAPLWSREVLSPAPSTGNSIRHYPRRSAIMWKSNGRQPHQAGPPTLGQVPPQLPVTRTDATETSSAESMAGDIRRARERAYGTARPTAAAMAARSAGTPVWRATAAAAWAQSMPSPSTAAAAPAAWAAATRPCARGP